MPDIPPDNRPTVAEAALRLLLAKALVRFVPMGRWRKSLGGFPADRSEHVFPADPSAEQVATLVEAKRLGRCVTRAAERLPGRTICLPQAIALQWMLGKRGIASRLVIAKLVSRDAPDGDPFHAWVEHSGEMVIGHCDRSAYAAVMTIDQPGKAASANGAGAG